MARSACRAARHERRPRAGALGPFVLPVFGLILLLLPYLPYLPDAIPALQVLAGPVRPFIWLTVIAQLAWVLWQSRLVTIERLQALAADASGHAGRCDHAGRLWRCRRAPHGHGALPGGDEPHYLVIAQSLWRDGDLKIENNHTRRDYKEYFAPDLEPHYLTRGVDNEIYSIHPVGMPVLMAPLYATGGYSVVVAAFVIMASVGAALMWLAIVSFSGSPARRRSPGLRWR